MDNQVEEVKRKTDIVEYIGGRIHLTKAGRNFRALCPFHQEKSASFVISPERQIWHCFGACHEGGDVIKFAMKWDNITFFEALRELAELAGVKLRDVSFKDQAWEKKDQLLRINSLATRYYEYVLHNTKYGKTALDYLTNRGMRPAIIKTFRIGYAPRSWDSVKNFFKKHSVSEEELVEAGLLIKNERGRIYDRFRGRIMFPIMDMRGDIVGFSGRILTPNDHEAKYINTPETLLYHKRESLYGIHLAKKAIRKIGKAILVEGEFDMISPYMHGIDNVVAIKGSAVTREQLNILKRITNCIVLALDADEAGEDAMQRGIQEAEKQDFELQIVNFTGGKDPDEILREDPVAFKKALKSAVPIYDAIIQMAQKRFNIQDAFGKKKIGDFVVPYLARIRNPIVQSHYIKKLSSILDVGDEAITSSVKKYRFKRPERKSFIANTRQKQAQNRDVTMQKYLLSRLFQSEKPYDLADQILNVIDSDDFIVPTYGKVTAAFLDYRAKHEKFFDRNAFAQSLPSELQTTYDELYLFSSSETEQPKDTLPRLIYEVKRMSLKRRISELLTTEKGEGDGEASLQDYTKKLNAVEKKLSTL